MRAGRLLSEILLLQSHRRMSGREIAARLEISARTVHRDMEALSAAGVPVFALRGARGGWQLDVQWRTEVPGLDESELRALLMSQPRLLGDARLSGAAERALGKLMASLPQPMREKAASIRQRLHVDTAAWRGTTEDLSLLPVVQDAVARDRRLLLHYRKPGERGAIAPRRVDPLGLVAKGSTWYLVANTQRGLRTFRVSRIEKAKLLEQEVKRPAGFDLAAYWKSSTEQFREGWRPFETVLRLEPRAAAWMQTWHIASTHQESNEPNAGDDWVTLRVRFDHEKEALFMVLGLGSRVEVLEPANLREQVTAEIAAVLGRSGALAT